MCFSAAASMGAGVALSVIGAFTLKVAREQRMQEPSSSLALASIPWLFAIQQLIEAGVWQSFDFDLPQLQTWTTHVYLLFSHVLWPVYVPLAVWLVESRGVRRSWLLLFVVIGGIVSAYLLYFLIAFPVIAHPTGHHIEYVSPHFLTLWVMGAYLVATTLSAMGSSYPMVRYFGALSLFSFTVVYYFYTIWFISVWCFFAAGLSAIIYLHFRLQLHSFKAQSTLSAPAYPKHTQRFRRHHLSGQA
jgi:hypothetical protein